MNAYIVRLGITLAGELGDCCDLCSIRHGLCGVSRSVAETPGRLLPSALLREHSRRFGVSSNAEPDVARLQAKLVDGAIDALCVS